MSRHVSSIKSKDAKRALRRWGFAATITRPDGNAVGQSMPGLVYGDFQEAKQVATRLKDLFLENNKDVQVKIDPIPYETVSIETKHQFQGLNDQSSLVVKAAFILADKYRLSIGIVDKDVAAIVDEAVQEARQFLYPRIDRANDRADELAGQGAEFVDGPVPQELEPDPDKLTRKRGIEAVQEALEQPV